jgi:hypothetical protein
MEVDGVKHLAREGFLIDLKNAEKLILGVLLPVTVMEAMNEEKLNHLKAIGIALAENLKELRDIIGEL